MGLRRITQQTLDSVKSNSEDMAKLGNIVVLIIGVTAGFICTYYAIKIAKELHAGTS